MPLLCSFYSKDNEGSWFRSLFVHKVDPRKDAHSTLLSKKETSNLYKIQCEWLLSQPALSGPLGACEASAGTREGLGYPELSWEPWPCGTTPNPAPHRHTHTPLVSPPSLFPLLQFTM